MKAVNQRLVPMGFGLAGVLFLVAAVKPVLNGQPLNAAFFSVGALCIILGIATARKSGGGTRPPSA